MENFNNNLKPEDEKIDNYPEELSLEKKLLNLKKENQELKDKLDNREKLFRIIAHDLKGPMGATTNLLELLSINLKEEGNSMDNKKLAFLLDEISKSSKNTFKLLEDLLAWSQLLQENKKPEMLNINLVNEIENSLASILEIAKQKNINLENKTESNLKVLADHSMLQTIIRNLTSNAIKFTNKGGNISISGEKKDNLVEIHIADDGVGLSEDAKQKIFDALRASKDGTEGEKGTRFGLSICKEFAEKMGGTIRVESEGEGQGTTFIVTLPAGDEKIEK